MYFVMIEKNSQFTCTANELSCFYTSVTLAWHGLNWLTLVDLYPVSSKVANTPSKPQRQKNDVF